MDDLTAGILLTPEKHIPGNSGDIFHIIKKESEGFQGFGEVYISTVRPNQVKGWKRHTKMTLNIVVPVGKILFVLYDNRKERHPGGKIEEVILSPANYSRLTVPPGIWLAFKCVGNEESFLVNFADIGHDPAEADTLPLENNVIPYEWK